MVVALSAHRPPQRIDDPSDLLMKAAQPDRAEVHVPGEAPRLERVLPINCVRSVTCQPRMYRVPPNKRLKLTGGDRFKGNGVLCPGAHGLSFNAITPCGRVARNLSALR